MEDKEIKYDITTSSMDGNTISAEEMDGSIFKVISLIDEEDKR